LIILIEDQVNDIKFYHQNEPIQGKRINLDLINNILNCFTKERENNPCYVNLYYNELNILIVHLSYFLNANIHYFPKSI